MKGLIIKADRAVLNVLTQYVRRWVAWQENKKHKIDFKIQFSWVQLVALGVWAIAIPTALWVIQGDEISAIVHALIWSLLGVFEWFAIQLTVYKEKPLYDILWSLREEPAFTKAHAEVLEEMFVDDRRERLRTTGLIVGITAVLYLVAHFAIQGSPDSMVWQYLIANVVANTLKRYLTYVNDFEPPKKKKKAAEAISEMIQRLWGETIGAFTPQPAFGI